MYLLLRICFNVNRQKVLKNVRSNVWFSLNIGKPDKAAVVLANFVQVSVH